MKTLKIISCTLLLLCLPLQPFFGSSASAANASGFIPGRIMDDGVFFNSSLLSANQVQEFLTAKMPTCDTNGTKPISGGSQTRAQWAAANGKPAPPYVCLKDYQQVVPAITGDAYCTGSAAAGTKSAAKIIDDVSKACGINPGVLIVLLQKEQGLVADEWPWPSQYQAATGYGCPDTAACDSQYYGFFNQVYNAARQFRRYEKQSGSFNYTVGSTSYVQYNPDAACGGTNIYIQTQATAGLYNYTPYQPNPATLAAPAGQTVNCGAYGNLNFWRYYTDWFGGTLTNCVYPQTDGFIAYRLYHPILKTHFFTTDPSEVCLATSQMGYMYDGKLFTVESPGSSTTPVFRLQKNGKYIYTASSQEKDTAVQSFGYTFDGVAFYGLDPVTNPTTARPVYRLSEPGGGYLYTISQAERDQLVQQSGYKNEGIGFYVRFDPGEGATTDTYRLANVAQGNYLYTIYPTERDAATDNYGYRFEGIGFKTFTKPNALNLPVYRLAGNKGYVLTTSLSERVAATRLGYRSEGVAFYAYAPLQNQGGVLFRLSSISGNYLYTSSSVESDSATKNFGYRLEGVGFNTP